MGLGAAEKNNLETVVEILYKYYVTSSNRNHRV